MRTKDIAEALAGRLDGDGAIEIDRLVHPARAERPSDLALAISADAAAALARSKAQAVVVSAEHPVPSGSFRAVIATDEARLALRQADRPVRSGTGARNGHSSDAPLSHPTPKLGAGVSIGAYVGGGRAQPHRRGTSSCRRSPSAPTSRSARKACSIPACASATAVAIGDRVIVHRQRRDRLRWLQFRARPDVDGGLHARCGADADPFARQCRDRRRRGDRRLHHHRSRHAGNRRASAAAPKSTITCHIGHNVTIGESCIVCGMVGISGSVTIGDRVRLGGGVGIGDHRADRRSGGGRPPAPASPATWPAGAFVSGYPAQPHQRALEQFVYASRQKRLHEKVEGLAIASRRAGTNEQEVMGALAL